MVFTRNAQIGLRSTHRWLVHSRDAFRRRQLSVSSGETQPWKKEDEASLSSRLKKRAVGSNGDVVKASASEIERGNRHSESMLQKLEEAMVGLNEDSAGSTKRKKRRKRTPAQQAAAAEMFSALAGPSDASPSSNEGQEDTWYNGSWGEDKLRPSSAQTSNSFSSYNDSPASFGISASSSKQALSYHRRIEGLLTTSQQKPSVLEGIDPISEMKPPAQLSHGLDRVLFNPGVHWVQDPRSRVYNFDPYMQRIPQVTDFAFERITGFVKSSRDEELWELCRRERRTFGGSTSSTSGMLTHIYFLLSAHKGVDTSCLSKAFAFEPTNYTPGQRAAASTLFNHKDGTYAIDSDGSDSDKNILTWLGHVLERFVTYPKEQFKSLLRSEPEPEPDSDTRREAFRYSKSKSFVLRSQLDAYDDRLPGTGVFDVKTRAAVPIRLDMMNVQHMSGYIIKNALGTLESFEKEYYDLIRSAFLKWTFQARIGDMDGMFVAYHNTARMFGFQYIPLEEMDTRVYGNKINAERAFEHCVSMLEEISQELTLVFPGESFRATFETPEGSPKLSIFVEPEEWDDAKGVRPMKLVEVTTESFLNGQPVEPAKAMASRQPWTVHWSITHSNLPSGDVRAQFVKVEQRRLMGWSLPDGVDQLQMKELWDKINYGGEPRSGESGLVLLNEDGEEIGTASSYDPDRFHKPSALVRKLRRLAKTGREQTWKDSKERKGMPKIVWGMPEVLEYVEEEPGLAEDLEAAKPDEEPELMDEADIVSVSEVDEETATEVESAAETEMSTVEELASEETEPGSAAFTPSEDDLTKATEESAAREEIREHHGNEVDPPHIAAGVSQPMETAAGEPEEVAVEQSLERSIAADMGESQLLEEQNAEGLPERPSETQATADDADGPKVP